MTNVGIITQARMTSTRLPGKVLLNAGGVSMLEHHLNRLEQSGLPVHVATTTNSTDHAIAASASRAGVDVFRGSETDVLKRYSEAASHFKLDVIVRVTSDCPLIDGELVRRGVERFLEINDERVYLSNTIERTYPRGFDFEVFSAALLREADDRATASHHREHVTPYLYAQPRAEVRLQGIRRSGDASGYRVTLDTADDFELIRRLIEDHDAARRDVESIIAVLDADPALAKTNLHVQQKKLSD